MQSDLERIVVDIFSFRDVLLRANQVEQIDAELRFHGMTRSELFANPDLLIDLGIAKKIRRACEMLQMPVSAHQSLVLARHAQVV